MKDINHLIRAGLLALLAIVGFTVARFLTLPESWGRYGHYRANAVAEEMAKEPKYQGADKCKACHSPRHKEWSEGKHGVVNCENCHGQAKEHVAKPVVKSGPKTISINRSNQICLKCHLELPVRPSDFTEIPHPQIDMEKHMKSKGNLQCFNCHNPHAPDLKPPEATETETTKPAGKEEPVKEGKPAPVVVSKIGKGVYEDKCLVCHAANGSGKTETSEFLDPKPPDFSAKSFKLKELIEFIRDGKGEAMPAYKDELSEEETKEVSKYIGGFRK